MMKVFKDLNYYSNYILTLIGLAIVSWIIWARFLRTRIPKDIPFELTEKWFFILIYICIIYFYIVYKLIRPNKVNESIKLIIELLFTPLLAFDKFIKENKYIQPYYLKIVGKTTIFIQSYKLVSQQYKLIKHIYITCYIIPRSMLISILCIDTFYFHKLELIYKIILIGVIPLFHRYIKYSIKYIKDQYIKDLEYTYKFVSLSDKNFIINGWERNPEILPYHEKQVTIKEYIDIELDIRELDNSDIGYHAYPYSHEFIVLDYVKKKYEKETLASLTKEDFIYFKKDFERLTPIILDLSLFLQSYSDVDDIYFFSKEVYILIKHVKIIIFGLYGICWTYILYRSYHMIPYPFVETLYRLIITLPALE
jgi:hypothetical protein